MSAGEAVALVALFALAAVAFWLLIDVRLWLLLRAWLSRARALRAARRRGVYEARDMRFELIWRYAQRAREVADRRVRAARERRQTKEERSRCLDELPELVDVVSLGLSAGVSFDAALDLYCKHYDSMLADALGDAMRSWRLGMTSRREALLALARRLDVPAFTTFVTTVGESLEFGAPLSRTLAEQAESARRARRSVLEGQVEKAPVKMLIPTGALVLPALLLAILGPLLSPLAVVA